MSISSTSPGLFESLAANTAGVDSGPAPVGLELLARQVHEISTLPHLALRIFQVAGDPSSGAGDLRRLVEADPPLAGRVLRCVNSSAFGLRTRISNLQQAITYLGMKQIRDLALAASVSDLFKQGDSIGLYRRSALWKHMVAVGLCARLIATRLKLENVEEVFLAGLLHDIGIIVEDQYCHHAFRDMILHLDPAKTLMEQEEQYLGFDHTRLGAKVAMYWRFPEVIQAAIRYHHTAVTYRGKWVQTVRCIELANLIATMKDYTAVGANLVRSSRFALEGLGLYYKDIEALSVGLDRLIAENEPLMQMIAAR